MAVQSIASTLSPDGWNMSAPSTTRRPSSQAATAPFIPGEPDSTDLDLSAWSDRSRENRITSQAEARPGPNFIRWISGVPSVWPHMVRLDMASLGLFASHGAERFPVLLVDALRDLYQVVDEAREAGFPEPSENAARNAELLLRRMFTLSDRRYEVYPTPDGEIAIDAPDGQGQSVLVLCSSVGDVLCLVNMKTGHRRAKYSGVAMLPDGFVREALADLRGQDY